MGTARARQASGCGRFPLRALSYLSAVATNGLLCRLFCQLPGGILTSTFRFVYGRREAVSESLSKEKTKTGESKKKEAQAHKVQEEKKVLHSAERQRRDTAVGESDQKHQWSEADFTLGRVGKAWAAAKEIWSWGKKKVTEKVQEFSVVARRIQNGKCKCKKNPMKNPYHEIALSGEKQRYTSEVREDRSGLSQPPKLYLGVMPQTDKVSYEIGRSVLPVCRPMWRQLIRPEASSGKEISAVVSFSNVQTETPHTPWARLYKDRNLLLQESRWSWPGWKSSSPAPEKLCNEQKTPAGLKVVTYDDDFLEAQHDEKLDKDHQCYDVDEKLDEKLDEDIVDTGGEMKVKISHKQFCIRDHKPLPPLMLDAAADQIYAFLKQGKNTYVHCKAGMARSGMAVIAFLLKYGSVTDKSSEVPRKPTVSEAIAYVTAMRPVVKVAYSWDKIEELLVYDAMLRLSLPPGDLAEDLAEDVADLAEGDKIQWLAGAGDKAWSIFSLDVDALPMTDGDGGGHRSADFYVALQYLLQTLFDGLGAFRKELREPNSLIHSHISCVQEDKRFFKWFTKQVGAAIETAPRPAVVKAATANGKNGDDDDDDA
ncbi:unnamed protein product [Amoebophrya sp. A120]|nr:unnamed protein product [Amoebophrya sp. A120]|eukprot:GSA120T00007940001.1